MPKFILTIIGLVLASSSGLAAAKDVRQCDSALSPTIERAASDYALVQSYMYVNSVHEYDKLKKSSASEQGASASYKFYSAEYNDSKNSSEFQKKVRNRLRREGYSMDESESRSSYRRYLSASQLTAWSICVQAVTGGGAVILLAESVSTDAFPVRVKWYPQSGVGEGTLVLRIRNASINGQTELYENLSGISERAFIVEPDNSKRQIVMTTEIVGAADTLVLPRAFPRAAPPKPSIVAQKKKLKKRISVAASDFMRPLNVALGGPGNIYGADVLLNAPDYKNVPNSADFEFTANAEGVYLLKVEYAAAHERSVQILINGEVAIPNALGAPTGCWTPNCQRLLNQGRVTLREGLNVMRVQRNSFFPHLRKFVFEPVN